MISKLLLVSILIATLAIPIRAARTTGARLGLRKAVFWFIAFNLFYLFALRVIYPRI